MVTKPSNAPLGWIGADEEANATTTHALGTFALEGLGYPCKLRAPGLTGVTDVLRPGIYFELLPASELRAA
jgi:hypothetical protein